MPANDFSALAPVNFMPKVQDFLNQRLVAMGIARTEFRPQLRSGQAIDWPFISDMRVQDYVPGVDLEIDATNSTSDTMLIDESRAATFTLDPNQIKQAEDKTVNDTMADQAAFRVSNDIDRQVLKEGADNAFTTPNLGSLTASNIFEELTNQMAALQRQNATDGTMWAVLDPERVALLAQSEVANGFNTADNALFNGFVGDSQAGFKIFNSNNLPTSVDLTLATNPTAADFVVIASVVMTFVAALTGTANEVLIGASASDTQDNLSDLVNNVSANAGSTFEEPSTDDRRALQNTATVLGTFTANVAAVTAAGKQGNTSNLTGSVTDGFGTETGQILFGRMGAISLGMQIMPTMFRAKEPRRPEENFIIHTLFGKKVFTRDARRLVSATINI